MKLALALFGLSLLFASVAQADEWGVSITNKTHNTATYTAEDIDNNGTIDTVNPGHDKKKLVLGSLADELVTGAFKHEPVAKKGDRIGPIIVTSNK